MSTRCKGCNTVVKRHGLLPHLRLSRNPQCELYHRQLHHGVLPPNNDAAVDATSTQVQVVNPEQSKDEEGVAAITECQSYCTS